MGESNTRGCIRMDIVANTKCITFIYSSLLCVTMTMRWKLRLIRHTGESCLVEFDGVGSSTILNLKEYFIANWPPGESSISEYLADSDKRQELKSKPEHSDQMRLIHFGKILDNKTPLSQFDFNSPQIVTFHLSLKPPRSKKSSCCIIL